MNLLATFLVAVLPVTGGVDDVSNSVAVVETFDGRGSGFLVDDTTVLSAAHVAPEGRVTVQFGDTQFQGAVVATDPANDLALIELDGRPGVDPLQLASAPPELGEDVLAIGAPTEGGLTVTRGIVSAVLDDGAIQTDASVNPGNSGGPLVRPDGEVLGVVTMKADAEGIGYAVGASQVRDIMDAPGGDRPPGDHSESTRGATPPDAELLPESSKPRAVGGAGPPVLPLGIAGAMVAIAVGVLAARTRATRNKDDFEVHLGPVHDRFGG